MNGAVSMGSRRLLWNTYFEDETAVLNPNRFCQRNWKHIHKFSSRRLPDRLSSEDAGSRTFLPSAGRHVHFTHSLVLTVSTCFQPVLTQAEIGASFLLMNRFPFLPFLKLQSVPRKTRAFSGMAVGDLRGHQGTFSRMLPSAQLLHGAGVSTAD